MKMHQMKMFHKIMVEEVEDILSISKEKLQFLQ